MPTLNWIGKDVVVNHHLAVPFRLLVDVPELACEQAIKNYELGIKNGQPEQPNSLLATDWHRLAQIKQPTAAQRRDYSCSNGAVSPFGCEGRDERPCESVAVGCEIPNSPSSLIVEGDNLLALKALLPYYKGQVKCIYIDPPYNTGNEGWIYNDNVKSPAITKWLGETVGKEGETLDRHDRWLCMMYPRLSLLREFLAEDGSIWISIDDNEVHSLRYMLDEIFGESNFVAQICWESRYSRSSDASFSVSHNFLLVYSPNPILWKARRNRLPRNDKQASQYKNPDNDPCGAWRAIPWDAPNIRPNLEYDIVTPSGKVRKPPVGRCWSRTEDQWKEIVATGRAYFGKMGNGAPSFKQYISDAAGIVPNTWWAHEDGGHTDEAQKEIQAIFETQTAFSTPKPTRLIQRILQIATKPGDLILDSFAGSGTTGHAVLKMNAADGGDRRFILVEMESKIAREITAERVRRVARGYTNAKGQEVAGLGGGFRFVKLGEELFDEHGRINEAGVRFGDLARHVWFCETGEPLKQPTADFSHKEHKEAQREQPNSQQPASHEGTKVTKDSVATPLCRRSAVECSNGAVSPFQSGDTVPLLQNSQKQHGQTGMSATHSAPSASPRDTAVGCKIPNSQFLIPNSPLLGIHNGRGIYLLYNGILKDKSVAGGNVLANATLAHLPHYDGEKVVYAAGCRLSKTRLDREGITFKQTPYAIRTK